MPSGTQSIVDELPPPEAYRVLAETSDAVLVDVRTRAEWAFVGMPDLGGLGRPVVGVEWATFPDMGQNAGFLQELEAVAGNPLPSRLLFICRSGARSMAAARLVASEADRRGILAHCTNVAEGFEGDLDAEGHRGRTNGWKVHGLPWRQN